MVAKIRAVAAAAPAAAPAASAAAAPAAAPAAPLGWMDGWSSMALLDPPGSSKAMNSVGGLGLVGGVTAAVQGGLPLTCGANPFHFAGLADQRAGGTVFSGFSRLACKT